MVDHIGASTAATTGCSGRHDVETQAGVLGGRPEHAGHVGGRPPRGRSAVLGGPATPASASEKSSSASTMTGEPLGGPDRRLQVARAGRRRRCAVDRLQQVLQRREQQRQRGAQFVADVLEELRLRPVEVGQRAEPVPFRVVGDGVGQRDPDLPADQVKERLVLLVQRPVRIDPEHHGADRSGASADRQRQHHRRVRGAADRAGPARTTPKTRARTGQHLGRCPIR